MGHLSEHMHEEERAGECRLAEVGWLGPEPGGGGHAEAERQLPPSPALVCTYSLM